MKDEKTLTEAFNVVREHLLQQKARSEKTIKHNNREVPVCMYRGDDGLKCAIGALIPDDLYTPSIERMGVDESPVIGLLKCARWPTDEEALCLYRELQEVHDEQNPEDWPGALELVRINRNL